MSVWITIDSVAGDDPPLKDFRIKSSENGSCMSLTNETDQLALLAFKACITNDPFHVVSSWNDSVPYCEWPGVICGGHGHPNRVRALRLSSSGLVGSMAPDIGNLNFLQEIYLYNNSFYGEIPHEHPMTSIPDTLGQITRLKILALPGNKLSGTILATIYNLSSLTVFDVGYNQLQGSLPSNLGFTLPWLSVLGNQFHGPIPIFVSNLSKLELLLAGGNSLTEKVAINFGGLSKPLFTGPIPSSLGNLTLLIELYLGDNRLQGKIPSSIGKCKYFLRLGLSVGRLTNLEILDVSENMLSREIPSTLGACTSLEYLFMKGNLFQGSIPSSLSSLRVSVDGVFRNLSAVLVIGNNKLCGATDEFSSTNLIGVGSFGSMYKGVLNHGKTIVAMKVLNIRQRGASKSFMVECKSMRNIWHRNLVRILTSCSSIDFEGNDFKALVYEFMPGGNLERISTILSVSTNRSQNHISSIGIKGSLGYIAPEYGAGADVSTHGDIYSYGILLLEMFTRKQPTHERFKDNFNLHCWAEMTLDGVMAIVDPSLLPMEEDEEEAATIVTNITKSRT
ncbi:receptor kinase-like protein Xa21 [Macadamia integrifolia]|uniref:receptor kinase-like protein Xa21 n=1 Tax=Macadamia integrifolia TaxID=60698 RepID=UPI001C4F29B6|nr:receptor kinase-like protein Xa21 [Macadamia integrifolia]